MASESIKLSFEAKSLEDLIIDYFHRTQNRK